MTGTVVRWDAGLLSAIRPTLPSPDATPAVWLSRSPIVTCPCSISPTAIAGPRATARSSLAYCARGDMLCAMAATPTTTNISTGGTPRASLIFGLPAAAEVVSEDRLAAALVVALASTASAQAKPDFSGS